MKPGEIIYYEDELNDEIIDFHIKKKKIDGDYKYLHKNLFYRLWSFVTYRLIATPIVWFYLKFHHVKIINKKILKSYKKTGYFIYGNHTNQFIDGFSPTITCFPKKPYIIVNPDNISMPFWGHFTRMWGALPLPDTIQATKNFSKALDELISKNHPILIYPEAHLWPYYTKIRPFTSKSFKYPIKYDKPVFTFTTTYHKRKFSKKPRIEIYVDGPFYPDKYLEMKARQEKLRNEVYENLVKHAQCSDYEYVKYIKKEHK